MGRGGRCFVPPVLAICVCGWERNHGYKNMYVQGTYVLYGKVTNIISYLGVFLG